MIRAVWEYIKANKKFLLLSFMMMSSVIVPIPRGQEMFYLTMLYIFVFSVQNKGLSSGKEMPFVLMLVFILLSSFVNMIFDIRLFLFIFIILGVSPIFSSYTNFKFKERLLKMLFFLIPVISVVNIYCHRAGINYFQSEFVNEFDFSGIMSHPMWLGALAGISNVALFYLIMKNKEKSWLIKGGLIFLLLCSLYVSVIAGSRSALAVSLVSMAFVLYLLSDGLGTIMKVAVVVGVIASMTLPTFMEGATRMKMKMENQDADLMEGGSRSHLWSMRVKEIEESPLFGVGFATAYVWGHKVTGRIESGSGWLSVISQTGILTFVAVMMIMWNCVPGLKLVKRDKRLALFYGELCYFTIHSFAEGYLYTSGYYPCLLFWMLVSYLNELPVYFERSLAEKTQSLPSA